MDINSLHYLRYNSVIYLCILLIFTAFKYPSNDLNSIKNK
ncbi:hypothetical protein Dd1591_2531 [Dickeya chrysanthemi Ech1591]|uniref:Uncharacterized protein n=1 Tax=Dickeya chrysanthemi (strain Ech1591) TaxID=561229 RepID=C6CL45_DICC1|nr:hypothetical protein Dd1591_2531 [Dickeya chrysanthemi Ech1591]